MHTKKHERFVSKLHLSTTRGSTIDHNKHTMMTLQQSLVCPIAPEIIISEDDKMSIFACEESSTQSKSSLRKRKAIHGSSPSDAARPYRPPLKKRRYVPIKKSVRFAEENNTVLYRHLSIDDLRQAWLSPEEYHAIRLDNLITLAAIKQVDGAIALLNPDSVCIRGLEGVIVRFLFKTAHRSQRMYTRCILQQQHVQRQLSGGKIDPEALKTLSLLLSKRDGDRAQEMAILDKSI